VNPAGVVLAIAGVWVISQVFAGHALERLNILPDRKDTPKSGGGFIPGVPDPGDLAPGGMPNIDYGNLLPGSGRSGL
jgi:hypothetical protein